MTISCSVKYFTGVTTTQGSLFLTADSKWYPNNTVTMYCGTVAQINKFKHDNLAGGDVIVEILYETRQSSVMQHRD